MEIKLSNEVTLYYEREEDMKEASEIVIDYTKMWEHENKTLIGDLLLELTNLKSNRMYVVDFYTIYDTNKIVVCVDLDEESAKHLAKRFVFYYNQEQITEVLDVRKAKLFDISIEDEDFEEVYLRLT